MANTHFSVWGSLESSPQHCKMLQNRKKGKKRKEKNEAKTATAKSTLQHFWQMAFSFSSFLFSHYWDFDSRQVLSPSQKVQYVILMFSRIESMILTSFSSLLFSPDRKTYGLSQTTKPALETSLSGFFFFFKAIRF